MTVSESVVLEYNGHQNGPLSPPLSEHNPISIELEEAFTRPQGYRVSYHHNPQMEWHHFGRGHPMKPWRLTLTNKLVMGFGMHEAMDMYQTRQATKEELQEFHTADYIDFLSKVTPRTIDSLDQKQMLSSGITATGDCPVFDDMFSYAAGYGGASLDAARKLVNDQADIAINWSGGLHHARKSSASGFCYVNDIVLAILQLLRYHPRVLYIDIDVHHGDGVEAAFWSTDRVLTLSLHRYNREFFFPGTGALEATGPRNAQNPGAGHSVNVPLAGGIHDTQYIRLFREVSDRVIGSYQPTAIVLQCGADSLGSDRVGEFNLNIQAHGACVAHIRRQNIPLLILGGGGYNAKNVSRCWAYETSVCLGQPLPLDTTIPANLPLAHYYGGLMMFPDLRDSKRKNENTEKELERLVEYITEQLRLMQGNPSVQMTEIPPDMQGMREDVEMEIKEEMEERNQVNGNDAVRCSRERGAGRGGELG